MDAELHLVMTISAVHAPSLLPFRSSLSTSVQPAARPTGCIRRIALQITRYYFPCKETNQIIMSFEFGLRWHPADSVSCMLLRRLRQLISSCFSPISTSIHSPVQAIQRLSYSVDNTLTARLSIPAEY